MNTRHDNSNKHVKYLEEKIQRKEPEFEFESTKNNIENKSAWQSSKK